MRVSRKVLVVAVVCTTAVAGLAGCGKDGDTKAKGVSEAKKPSATASPTPADLFAGMTPDAIADKAVGVTKAANTVKVAGAGISDGEHMTMQVTVTRQGNCSGKATVKGGTVSVLKADAKSYYVKGDEKFYRAMAKEDGTPKREADAMIEVLKGRWMKMPADALKKSKKRRGKASGDDMGQFCVLSELVAGMDDDKADRTGMTKGADTVVAGVPAVTLTKKKSDGSVTMYVAKQGPARLLKVAETGGDEPGTVTFSDYDKPVTITPLPADQIMDLEKLGMKPGGGSGSGGTDELKV
ncbi:hypothetical protein [Streptomyces sp. BPTC-684]|uniref:hypothetical protein n=1 Tax=Streptomyces sp. BPTC-684 TaxID=3043734 RepID=UPI0024B17E57|nr:hypothetical protein [Streptomyces sp. BPTC-684]WHM36740.1 hypothetical protein QIY60_07420 [Streptomyces sp. BPTC-684]